MAVTLRDIAKHLNLSHATVSFVLNDRRDVAIPDRTRERVLKAAAELGYRPNRSARALVMGRTNILAIWTPSLRTSHLLHLFEALHAKFQTHGYETLYCEHPVSPSRRPYTWPVDGIVAVECSQELIAAYIPTSLPTITIGGEPSGALDHVMVDRAGGVVQATLHLLEKRRRRLALLTLEEPGSLAILDAFRIVIEAAGLQPVWRRFASGDDPKNGQFILELLTQGAGVDAIICTDHRLATVCHELIEKGSAAGELRIEVIEIVGHVAHSAPARLFPAIEFSVQAIAQGAVELLTSRLDDASLAKRVVHVPVTLVVPSE